MADDPLFSRFGREFPDGHALFREGDVGAVMYVIREGRVRISRTFDVGERTLSVLGPGEFFGEMAILNGRPRSANATALGPLRVVEVDAATLESMVANNAEIAVRLITRLARRLDDADRLIELLLHGDPRVRVILALARAAEELGARRDDGIALALSTAELAETAGVTEAEADGTLRRLDRVRMISRLADGTLLVPEARRLQEFVALLDGAKGRRRTNGARAYDEAPRGVGGGVWS